MVNWFLVVKYRVVLEDRESGVVFVVHRDRVNAVPFLVQAAVESSDFDSPVSSFGEFFDKG